MIIDSRQYALTLIPRDFNGSIIEQCATDGYINATAMCRATEKLWADYYRLTETTAFLEELSIDMGIPILQLIQSVKGGDPKLQDTWIHPQVAIHFGQWLSPKFAVQVSKWVYEWMSGLGSPASTHRSTPMFVQRFNDNWDRVETGYFSVISELFIRVYGRLEQAGHVIADKALDGKQIRPDVSVGKTFRAWAEEKHPGLKDKCKNYSHKLPDGMEVTARQYHTTVLPAFIEFIDTEWLPNRAADYFRTRDPEALAFLPKLLSAPPSTPKIA